jgi:hypothetical protein
MVTPAAKREAVAHLRSAFEVSERRACPVRQTAPRSTIAARDLTIPPYDSWRSLCHRSKSTGMVRTISAKPSSMRV